MPAKKPALETFIMTATYYVRFAAIVGIVLSVYAPVFAVAATDLPSQSLNTNAQIYLLRGLANVFSKGMDEIAGKLRQRGFSPHVMNWRRWQSAADRIAKNYRSSQMKPIILIGHSLGANSVFRMAKRLNAKGVPVDYLATFDPTESFSVPRNVRAFVNFYQRNGFGRKASFPAAKRDDMVNLNLTSSPGLTHGNIDQSPRLQDIVIAKILRISAQ